MGWKGEVMQDRFKFKGVLKNKTENLSEPFLKNNLFDILKIGFSGDQIETVTLVAYHDNDDYSVYEADAKDVELIQCTGLKDKNGKLIFEGDILKYTSKPTNTQKNNPEYKPYSENYSVVWEDFYTGYNLRSKEKVNCFNLGIMTKDCEVIGNIYENKELLDE